MHLGGMRVGLGGKDDQNALYKIPNELIKYFICKSLCSNISRQSRCSLDIVFALSLLLFVGCCCCFLSSKKDKHE